MVCTGNICRSAYAERLLQRQLDQLAPDGFQISSAGTHALVGYPMEPSAAERLALKNGSDMDFAARQLNEHALAGIDFALTMTEEHRTAVVSMSPKMLKRAYTLREFAAVLDEIETDRSIDIPRGRSESSRSDRWAAIRECAPLKRHIARSRLIGKLDIADPYRRGDAAFDTMVEEMTPLLARITSFETSHG